jgi:hypothetical protein
MLPSTTFCRTSWLVPQAAKEGVYIDAQLLVDSIVSQRDWNEDVFGLLAMPSDDFVSRDRNIIKTQVEFVEAAHAAAVAAVDGALAPANPLEDIQSHIYIANNLFVSRCVDNFDSEAARCSFTFHHHHHHHCHHHHYHHYHHHHLWHHHNYNHNHMLQPPYGAPCSCSLTISSATPLKKSPRFPAQRAMSLAPSRTIPAPK